MRVISALQGRSVIRRMMSHFVAALRQISHRMAVLYSIKSLRSLQLISNPPREAILRKQHNRLAVNCELYMLAEGLRCTERTHLQKQELRLG